MNNNLNLFDEKRDRRNKRTKHKARRNKRDTIQAEPVAKIEELCQNIVNTDPETSEDEFEQCPSLDSLFFHNTLDGDGTLEEILMDKQKIIGGHFQFKHEKQWEQDEDQLMNEKFTLDINAIAKNLGQIVVDDLISKPTFVEDDDSNEQIEKVFDISNDELLMSIVRDVSGEQQANVDIPTEESISGKNESEGKLEGNEEETQNEENSDKNELEDWLDNILDD